MIGSLEDKSDENALKSVGLSNIACFIVYSLVGIIGVLSFGKDLNVNVLVNVGSMNKWQSYFLRGIFLVVVSCHIPFNFFATKEAILIAVDEYRCESISK